MVALFEDAKRVLEANEDLRITPERFGLNIRHKMEGEVITEDQDTYGVCLIGAGLLGRELKFLAEDPDRNFPLEDSVLRAYYPHLCADCISAGFARDASLGHRQWQTDRGHELIYQMARNFRPALGLEDNPGEPKLCFPCANDIHSQCEYGDNCSCYWCADNRG
jgi:hypothetical protein